MGVEMPAGASESPGVESKVLWDYEGKTAAEAFSFVKEGGKYSAIELQSELETAENAVALLRAKSKSQGLVTGVQALSGTSAANSYVQALASGEAPYVIKGDGASSFLQLAETAKRKLKTSELTAEWAGGSRNSKTVSVTHGLGATPQSVDLTALNNGSFVGIPIIIERTSTKFVVEFFVPSPFGEPGAGNKQTYLWTAIG